MDMNGHKESNGRENPFLGVVEDRTTFLPIRNRAPIDSNRPQDLDIKVAGRRAVQMAEQRIICIALQKTRWNRKQAAKLLRMSYKALLYKIKEYHLKKPGEDFFFER